MAACASLDSFQTLEFIHTFSNKLFGLLSNNTSEITVAQMKRLGRVMGIRQRDMRKCVGSLGWGKKGQVGHEEFELFYFALFDMIFKLTNPKFGAMYEVRPESRKVGKKCSDCLCRLFGRNKKKSNRY